LFYQVIALLGIKSYLTHFSGGGSIYPSEALFRQYLRALAVSNCLRIGALN